MDGSKKELEERIAETHRTLKAMEESLARTQEMIDRARRFLDEARGGVHDRIEPPPESA